MPTEGKKVIVVGGGVSGLSAAHFVEKKARQAGQAVQVRLLEQESRPGGKFDSVRKEGYIVEAGPNGFLDSKPWTLDLVRELGMEGELLPSDQEAARRFIFSRGRLHELKASPVSFFMGGPLSPAGRLRIMGEPLARTTPAGTDTSLAEFATRRLGREALERLLDPMVSGIFAGDPERMSLRASFPRIAELEEKYGSLTGAMLRLAREKKQAKKRGEDVGVASGPSGPGGVLTSFREGVSQLTDAMARNLGEGCHTGVRVKLIAGEGSGFRVLSDRGDFTADAVILATPADSASSILEKVAPRSGSLLAQIPYSPMAVVGLGFDIQDLGRPPRGFGFLIPSVEGRKILGALWTSSIFPAHRSPQGKFLIRAMVGGARDHTTPFLDDEDLVGTVRRELASTMELTASPSFTTVIRWDRAIPLYTVGHLDRLGEAEKALPRGIVLAGNAYRGVGINDCVREAEVAAEKVMTSLFQA